MSKIVSTRLNEDELSELNDLAMLEHLDRATLLHKLIVDKIIEIRKKKMGELYQKGILSLQEAATAAKVSIYEMMEYIQLQNIHPPEISNEEMEKQFHTAQKLLKNSEKHS